MKKFRASLHEPGWQQFDSSLPRLLCFLNFMPQPSKLKFLLGRHLATNSFGLGDFFTNQVASFKILGAIATKMVATWRVVPEAVSRMFGLFLTRIPG